LEDVYSDYRDLGFQIIGVILDGNTAAWADEFGLTFPVLDDSDWALWDRYDGTYIPLNLVLDRNMVIRYRDSGYDELEIKSIIGEHISPP